MKKELEQIREELRDIRFRVFALLSERAALRDPAWGVYDEINRAVVRTTKEIER